MNCTTKLRAQYILKNGVSARYNYYNGRIQKSEMNGGDDMAKTKPTYADSLKKITDADNAVKQALARKRELIEQSKLIAYDEIAQLYGAEGQALIDAVTQ